MTIPPDGTLQAEQELTKRDWQRLPRRLRQELTGRQIRLMSAPEVDAQGNQTGRMIGPTSIQWDLYRPLYMPLAAGIIRMYGVTSWREVMRINGLQFRNDTSDRKVIRERFASQVDRVGEEIDLRMRQKRKEQAEDAKLLKLPDPGLAVSSTRKKIIGVLSVREIVDGETGQPVIEVTCRVREYHSIR